MDDICGWETFYRNSFFFFYFGEFYKFLIDINKVSNYRIYLGKIFWILIRKNGLDLVCIFFLFAFCYEFGY